MPLFDMACQNQECGLTQERYLGLASYPDPACGKCGGATRRLPGVANLVWVGPISSRYRDKRLEGFHDPDGVWMTEKNTVDGKPRPVHLRDWADVKSFASREGLVAPNALGSLGNAEINEDGTKVTGAGLPGQWT